MRRETVVPDGVPMGVPRWSAPPFVDCTLCATNAPPPADASDSTMVCLSVTPFGPVAPPEPVYTVAAVRKYVPGAKLPPAAPAVGSVPATCVSSIVVAVLPTVLHSPRQDGRVVDSAAQKPGS